MSSSQYAAEQAQELSTATNDVRIVFGSELQERTGMTWQTDSLRIELRLDQRTLIAKHLDTELIVYLPYSLGNAFYEDSLVQSQDIEDYYGAKYIASLRFIPGYLAYKVFTASGKEVQRKHFLDDWDIARQKIGATEYGVVEFYINPITNALYAILKGPTNEDGSQPLFHA